MKCLPVSYFSWFLYTIFLSSCGESNKYLKQYSFFSNADEYVYEGTISLNNFKSKQNKNGLEYLITNSFRILEVRNWKNNSLNGNVFSYATNGKVKMLCNYSNDSICDYFYELDTITGNVITYFEKVKDGLGIIDNKVILFKDGKVDIEHSKFYAVRYLYGNTYRIFWLGKKDYPFMKIIFHETNEDKYIFENGIDSLWVDIGTKKYYDYNLQDTTCKYISGSVFNYRYLTVEEIKEQGAKEGEISGLIMNFKCNRHTP